MWSDLQILSIIQAPQQIETSADVVDSRVRIVFGTCATGRENRVSLGTMCDMRPGGSSQVSMMQRKDFKFDAF